MAVIGEIILELELVSVALNGFTKQWDVFTKCIVGREHPPTWERMWDDFIQEEIREGAQRGDQKKNFEEGDLALASKGKPRVKKGPSDGSTSKGEKKKDRSKIKCFACQQRADNSL